MIFSGGAKMQNWARGAQLLCCYYISLQSQHSANFKSASNFFGSRGFMLENGYRYTGVHQFSRARTHHEILNIQILE